MINTQRRKRDCQTKKAVLLFILCLFCTGKTWTQIDATYSQYFMALGYYNPGYAGTTGELNALAMHRQQWVGIEGAPKSFFITADMPVTFAKKNHGIGISVFTDKAGLFQNTVVGGQYSYKQKLLGGTLSVGLQLGIANLSFDAEGIYIPVIDGSQDHIAASEDEGIPTTSDKGMGLDMNAGVFYTHKNFYAGLGVMHLTEPNIELDENVSTYIARTFNFAAGYNIQLNNPLYELQPSVFMLTDMQSFSTNITARVVYNKMFNGGLAWRVNESVILLLGASVKGFQVGYSYDLVTTSLKKGSSGSHEVFLRFTMKLKKTKTGLYRHKSVRIL